jgi:hypothetical protein
MAPKTSKPETHKGGRHRSPNYPAVSLPEAVERTKALVEKDGKAGAPSEAAAKNIGFSGAHGTARTVLSALKKFGLTADQRGRIVPTQLALDIIHFSPDNPRNKAARQVAVLNPQIYKQLVDRFAEHGDMPSPESLKSELIADIGFNPKAVDAFISDFFSSLQYAGMLDGNRLLLSDEQQTGSIGRPDPRREPQAMRPQAIDAGWGAVRGLAPTGTAMRELTLPLMDNEVAYLRLPMLLSAENYDYLLQQISLMRRGLVVKRQPTQSDEVAGNFNHTGLPIMITNEMRRKLLEMGHTPAEIAEMTPQKAWIAISHQEGQAFDTSSDD